MPSLFADDQASPFLALHREVNRLFDDAFRSFDAPSLFGRVPGWPNLEISETEKEHHVAAELPGLDEKDVEVLLADGVLTIRGEKKSETEDKERQFSERFYGRFERQIPLGAEVEADKAAASFQNGVLTVRPDEPRGSSLSEFLAFLVDIQYFVYHITRCPVGNCLRHRWLPKLRPFSCSNPGPR